MKRILITGFEPFGGEAINPSYEAIKKMDTHHLLCDIHMLELPVAFYDSSRIIIDKIHDLKPDVVVMVGQAGGRKEISIERVAINIDDSMTPDNKGVTPIDDPISIFGPHAYFSTLPIKSLLTSLKKANIPCHISNSAGTYVCNHIFYSVMHELYQQKNKNVIAGFIHVPYETNQVLNKPDLFSLDQRVITQALEIIIQTICENTTV
ncbi:MAG: pyroglutamyl-peptidase I [Acholeplasmataceae bacterium]|jgi:pyroglutamyl-peptidase|nr:pyroglutamyl-peptidase I [Acholeplasmataceae bacterium]